MRHQVTHFSTTSVSPSGTSRASLCICQAPGHRLLQAGRHIGRSRRSARPLWIAPERGACPDEFNASSYRNEDTHRHLLVIMPNLLGGRAWPSGEEDHHLAEHREAIETTPNESQTPASKTARKKCSSIAPRPTEPIEAPYLVDDVLTNDCVTTVSIYLPVSWQQCPPQIPGGQEAPLERQCSLFAQEPSNHSFRDLLGERLPKPQSIHPFAGGCMEYFAAARAKRNDHSAAPARGIDPVDRGRSIP